MMQMEKRKLEDLNPAEYNPRKISEAELNRLKKSIEVFGYIDPIIWNKRTGNIVGGHQRYKALQELGYEEADVRVVDVDLTKEKALNVALNKISGEFDIEKVKDTLEQLDVGGLDIELTGFTLDEVEQMMTRTYQEFSHEEIDIDDFEDDAFTCRCPKCDFHFNE